MTQGPPEALADRFVREFAAFIRLFKTNRLLGSAFVLAVVVPVLFQYWPRGSPKERPSRTSNSLRLESPKLADEGVAPPRTTGSLARESEIRSSPSVDESSKPPHQLPVTTVSTRDAKNDEAETGQTRLPYQLWDVRRPYPNSDVDFVANEVRLHSRGTLILKDDYKAITIEGSGSFADPADVLDVYLRSGISFSNPFGAPDRGVAIHFNAVENMISILSWRYGEDGAQTIYQTPFAFRPSYNFSFAIVDEDKVITLVVNGKKLFQQLLDFEGSKVIIHNRESSGHTFTFKSLDVRATVTAK